MKISKTSIGKAGTCITHTDETKIKISQSLMNHIVTLETRMKHSNRVKGRKWFNNGVIETQIDPKFALDGWVAGRIKRISI